MLRDGHRLRDAVCTCAAAIALTLGTAACGIKGPLKPAPAAPAQPSTAPTPAPAPNAPAPAQEPTPPAPPRS